MATRTTRVLWFVHLIANVAYAALFWAWLGIPDARTWHLGLTAVVGLTILIGILWLHGSTFRYFSDSDSPLQAAFRNGFRRLPLFTIWAAVFVLCIVLLGRWAPAGKAAIAVRWLLAWIIVPAVLVPGAVAAVGHAREALAAYRSPKYWIIAAMLLVVGVYVPYRVILWAPQFKSFAAEATSLGVRWGIAYLLLVTAWLMLAYVSSGGIPRFSQPKTASLP